MHSMDSGSVFFSGTLRMAKKKKKNVRRKAVAKKRKRIRVGLTAGAMDLCHAGHILMLKEAKKVCDYLIVLLHKDPSVARQAIHSSAEDSLTRTGDSGAYTAFNDSFRAAKV